MDLRVTDKELKKELRNLGNYKICCTERQRNGNYEREIKRHKKIIRKLAYI